jgi:hypothetical protein
MVSTWLVSLLIPLGCGDARHRPSPATDGTAALARLGLTRHLPETVVNGCADVARAPVRVVVCPPVVPAGRAKPNLVRALGPQGKRRRGWSYVLDFSSRVLTRWRGRPVAANGGHWIVAAGTDPWLLGQLAPRQAQHPRVEHVTVNGQAMREYWVRQASPSYFAGHVTLVWPRAGVTYFVSAHGFANAARVQTMARALVGLEDRCLKASAPAAGCRGVTHVDPA